LLCSLQRGAALPLFAGDSYQLDPFKEAVPPGIAACPTVAPPTLTPEQMRAQAHSRVERGTSCCLAGTCECGGSYKHDPEINARVAAAIRNDVRFRNASIWITTTRKFVTLQGSVRTPAQKRALARLVRRQPAVAPCVEQRATVGPLRHAPFRQIACFPIQSTW
jgi:hypothetical protein